MDRSQRRNRSRLAVALLNLIELRQRRNTPQRMSSASSRRGKSRPGRAAVPSSALFLRHSPRITLQRRHVQLDEDRSVRHVMSSSATPNPKGAWCPALAKLDSMQPSAGSLACLSKVRVPRWRWRAEGEQRPNKRSAATMKKVFLRADKTLDQCPHSDDKNSRSELSTT